MYQDWMDGVPLLLSGSEFKEYNRQQLAIARDYYRGKGNEEQAKEMENAMKRYY